MEDGSRGARRRRSSSADADATARLIEGEANIDALNGQGYDPLDNILERSRRQVRDNIENIENLPNCILFTTTKL